VWPSFKSEVGQGFWVVNSYVVLARKWRPAQFADIVGQGHIVRTLMNAIQAKRIHQAYLFTGSRGIGKTSIARIFAKVIRCEHTRSEAAPPASTPLSTDEQQQGNWLRSCDDCASCKEITAGNSVDVIEIDGASNNGVDAVREIRENAKFLPATGGRKIYIIDEVHMLSTAAFNALLKTLEEPPPHVIFVFATTEPHKIPATILSRCQRFDYRRVTLTQIQNRLIQVTTAEGIQTEPGALALIARAAEGSMRDALSLLDQVIAFSGDRISVQSVRDSIGLIEGQTVLGILAGVFGRKPLDALALVDQAYQRGHDFRVLTRTLIEFLHGAVLAKVGASNSAMLQLSEDESKELRAIAELRPLEEIELIFQVLHHGLEWIARSPQPKVILDILLVKCATADALVYAEELPAQPVQPGATGSGFPGTKAIAAQPQPIPATPAPIVTAPIKTTSEKSWPGFIEHTRKTRPLLASMLEHGSCEDLDPGQLEKSGELTICYPAQSSHYRDQLQSRVYQEQLQSFSKEYFGRAIRIQIELKDGGESLASKRERERLAREHSAKEAVHNHPIIREAKSLFGGELGPIELSDSDSSDSKGGSDDHSS